MTEFKLGGSGPDVSDAAALLVEAVERHGFVFGAVAKAEGGGPMSWVVAGRTSPGGPLLESPKGRLRVASISKAAVGRLAACLADEGRVPLNSLVVDLLRWTDAPQQLAGVSLRDLLGHVSGLRDRSGYTDPNPVALIQRAGEDAFGPEPPGYFTYANLNTVLAAAALETELATPFGTLIRRYVTCPAGIAGGFNWVDAPRYPRIALWQRQNDGYRRTTDADDSDWDADLIFTNGRGHSLCDIRLGEDAGLWSPQGGLRLSLEETLRLGQVLATDDAAGRIQRDVIWRFDGQNGADCDGLYQAMGLGLMRYRDHPRVAAPLFGHAGHALGFTGGVWVNADNGRVTAIFLNGAPDLTEGQEDEAFYDTSELALMALC